MILLTFLHICRCIDKMSSRQTPFLGSGHGNLQAGQPREAIVFASYRRALRTQKGRPAPIGSINLQATVVQTADALCKRVRKLGRCGADRKSQSWKCKASRSARPTGKRSRELFTRVKQEWRIGERRTSAPSEFEWLSIRRTTSRIIGA